MTFEAKLDIFEGPLDLLLHLIKINEVDISDIPITTITDQYLEYLDLMKAIDVNVAGDFLVMASTLMYIKSKMLLPKNEHDLEDIEDPREEIVRPLLEYMQLKEASEELSSRDILNRDVFKRGAGLNKDGEDNAINITGVSIYQLMDAFKKIVQKKDPNIVLRFTAESWSVKEKAVEIMNRLTMNKKINFNDLFSKSSSVSEMIAIFLAMLDLVKRNLIIILQEKPEGDIWIEASGKKNKPVQPTTEYATGTEF
jgi:segregation and condensation protein A